MLRVLRDRYPDVPTMACVGIPLHNENSSSVDDRYGVASVLPFAAILRLFDQMSTFGPRFRTAAIEIGRNTFIGHTGGGEIPFLGVGKEHSTFDRS